MSDLISETTLEKSRYFLELAYHGGSYHGWQIQDNALSVQAVVEQWLAKVVGEPIQLTASGRTDTGVHAECQVAHADLPAGLDKNDLAYKLNAVLPRDIAIRSIVQTIPGAHARFNAVSRSYQYKIHREKDPFLEGLSHLVFGSLDIKKMNDACGMLLGDRDFESFSKVKTAVSHFRCNITEAYWLEEEGRYFFKITANRFLRGMVRAMVGAMLDIGSGKTTVAGLEAIIESRDRRKAGKAAPPCGLYLSDVKYPGNIFIDSPSEISG